MNSILEWLGALTDIIMSLINLVITLVNSVIWFVTNLPQFVSGITASFAYAPTFLVPFLSASVALFVVFAIIRLL